MGFGGFFVEMDMRTRLRLLAAGEAGVTFGSAGAVLACKDKLSTLRLAAAASKRVISRQQSTHSFIACTIVEPTYATHTLARHALLPS